MAVFIEHSSIIMQVTPAAMLGAKNEIIATLSRQKSTKEASQTTSKHLVRKHF